MDKTLINKPEIKLIGLTARTNNKNEMNPQTSKIAELANHYWGNNISTQIPHRKSAGVTFSAYTEYDSNEHGDYTYFVGEEVTSFDNIPAEMQTLVIPASKYQKFTTPSGKMPDVVIAAWQQIWNMTSDDFGGDRAYQADFEIYDERASDPANTRLDIYIGVK